MRVLPCGAEAVLLDCASGDEARSWHDTLSPVYDVVLGARTVLVYGAPDELRRTVSQTRPAEPRARSGRLVHITVRYDGPDLADVARQTGLSIGEIIDAHTRAEWTVAFAGFAPGFAYLTGGDPRLSVPRRETPRERIDAGSVGLAGGFSGIYPQATPGGWQLIGRTDADLFDPACDPPAFLQPGMRVRFEAVSIKEGS